MMMAEMASRRSTCSRLQVGAVVVQNGNIVGTGYNGAPRGIEHCVHDVDAPCRVSVHAEANALIHATGYQKYWFNSMYITHSPCYDCSKLIINAGVWQVYYRSVYRSHEGLDLLAEAGVGLEKVQ